MKLEELYRIILDRREHPTPNSYTASLFAAGEDEIVKKVGEEAIEVILAAKSQGKQRLIEEIADLTYHSLGHDGPNPSGSRSRTVVSSWILVSSARITAISGANSNITCRQTPHGLPPLLVATAIATKSRYPSDTALVIATRSAQMLAG